jgi:hypothetical protein
MRLALAIMAVMLLGACSASLPNPPPQAAGLTSSPVPQECVPYARQVSGIELFGDAWTWWDGAAGRYDRGRRPFAGSVLVLSRSGRLRLGHLAVVTAVDGPRRIRVTHTNWGSDDDSRRRVYRDMPVIDVSADNRWTAVRFWNFDLDAYGGAYPAQGFIYRRAPAI